MKQPSKISTVEKKRRSVSKDGNEYTYKAASSLAYKFT